MDVRTLIATNLVLLGTYAAALWLLSATQPGMKGVRWLKRTFISALVGSILIVLRGKIPDTLSVVVGCELVIGALALLHAGLAEFVGRSFSRLRADVVVLGLMLALYIPYTYIHPSVATRIVIYSSAMAAETALCTGTLLLADPADRDLSVMAMAALFGLITIFGVARAIFTSIYGAPAVLMSRDPWQALAVLVQILISSGLAFGFVWMTTARLHRELERMVRTDFLTGLLNRRALLEEAEREIARSRRNGTPLSVLLIDIDHFKQVNDTCGHTAGDAALCTIARLLLNSRRNYGHLARYGGEEFIMLLPETAGPDAFHIAERLRTSIHSANISPGHSGRAITISIGAAELDSPDGDWDALIRRADHALYTAKLSGRNRTIADSLLPDPAPGA